MARTINWKSTRADVDAISKVLYRADALAKLHGAELPDGLMMDLTAAHLNGCPMDWAKLLAADDCNFAHDVWGIHRHINRKDGTLGDCFLPRCAAR